MTRGRACHRWLSVLAVLRAQRCLNARQFGLKLIANVSYGYTSAGFSGRMPMAELADSIVQSGRQTLENAIRMVHGRPDWDARVVYGDTGAWCKLDVYPCTVLGCSNCSCIGMDIARCST